MIKVANFFPEYSLRNLFPIFFLTEIRLKDGTKHQGWEGVIVLKVMIPPCQKVTMRKCGRKIMLK